MKVIIEDVDCGDGENGYFLTIQMAKGMGKAITSAYMSFEDMLAEIRSLMEKKK